MKVFVLDEFGEALDFCLRCMAAGHDVRWYMKDQGAHPNDIGDGMVTKVREWEPQMKWADLVVLADNVHYLKDVDAHRRRGARVFGPTMAGAELELDREKGQELFARCGIETIPYEIFNSYDKAIRHVIESGQAFACKPFGDANKAMSYVGKTAADMVFMLERWRDNGKGKGEFILQEKRTGFELAVGGWMTKNGFGHYFLENFEHKKLLVGNMGPNVGEMGTVIKYVERSILAERVLMPCEEAFRKMGVTGYVDVNCIVDEHGTPWPLEFTVRPGWPTFNIQASLHVGDPAQWMLDAVEGRDTLEVRGETCVGVVMAIPPFPYESAETQDEMGGYPIYGLEDCDPDAIHLCQAKYGDAPAMDGMEVETVEMEVTAGCYVLVATGLGDTVKAAAKAAYKQIENISIPASAFYRNDIGKATAKELPELQEMGYCTDWEGSARV